MLLYSSPNVELMFLCPSGMIAMSLNGTTEEFSNGNFQPLVLEDETEW